MKWGEVPMLVDQDLTLTQSGAIQMYISEKSGKFGGQTPDEVREVMRWVLWDNNKLSGQAGMCRFLINFLPEDKRPAEVIAWYQGRLKTIYTILEGHLNGSDWIVGNGPTNADFSCCGYLFYPRALWVRPCRLAEYRPLAFQHRRFGRLETPL